MTGVKHDLSTEAGRRVFNEIVMGMVLNGKTPVVEFVESRRSDAQNNALHLWCEMVANALNDAGLDMRHTIREEVEMPWTKSSVKEYLWRPLQKAMTGEESTTMPAKSQYPEISEMIARHLSARFGITLPAWPDRHGPMEA